MSNLEEISDRHREPYTLICLYIRTLPSEERETLAIKSDKYDQMRFHAKAMRSLVEGGFVLFDWEQMEATLTQAGVEKAKVLIEEIGTR